MASKAGCKEMSSGVGTEAKLREAVLVANDVGDMDASTRNYVKELAKRLERVRGWGGAYSSVGFSPQVKKLADNYRPVILSAESISEIDCDRSARRAIGAS